MVVRTTKDNIQLGHTSLRKIGQIQPNDTSSGNLSMFDPARQLVIPEPRPNVSMEKQWVDQLNEVDCALTNTSSSLGESPLCILETAKQWSWC